MARAQLALVRQLKGGRTEVTLEGSNSSITFGIQYGNVTTDMYVALLEVTILGPTFTDLETQMKTAQVGEDAETTQRIISEINDQLEHIKERLRVLPAMLADTVLSQELDDEAGVEVKPSAEYFTSLPLEFQVAYANAVIAGKQRPTTDSAPISLDSSIPAGSTESVTSSGDVSAPPNIPETTGATSTAAT